MFRKLFLAVVVIVVLAPVTGIAAAPLAGAPIAGTVVLGTLGAELTARDMQTATLDSEVLMDGVNQGVEYGFTFANAFIPLIIIMVGFAVAGGVLGLLVKLGPQIAKMIKNAF